MVKVRFVDIEYLDEPHLWKQQRFSVCKCDFASTGITTIVCPAIKQIMQAKDILYLFDDESHNNAYILTNKDKEKDEIKLIKHECIHRAKCIHRGR